MTFTWEEWELLVYIMKWDKTISPSQDLDGGGDMTVSEDSGFDSDSDSPSSGNACSIGQSQQQVTDENPWSFDENAQVSPTPPPTPIKA